MKKKEINWKAYHKDLQASLSNERIWALGYTDSPNPHLQNIEEIEEELKDLEQLNYDGIINKHSDTPEYFNDFLINGNSTQFPSDENKLYTVMEAMLAPEYYPTDYSDDTIYKLACEEFCRVRELICQKFHFNEEKFIKENEGISPFDLVRSDIEQRVLERLK